MAAVNELLSGAESPTPSDRFCIRPSFGSPNSTQAFPAIILESGEAITYGQLHARTNQVARCLRKWGVGPESRGRNRFASRAGRWRRRSWAF